MTTTTAPHTSFGKRVAAFLILFALYQSAEGIGARVLHNGAIANGLMLASLLAAPLVSRWLGWGWFSAYGLEPRRDVGLIVLCGLAIAAVAKLATLFAGAYLDVYAVSAAPDAMDADAAVSAIAFAMLVTAVPSLAEDIVTRGFWLRGSEIKWTGAAFILATSTIYLLNHVYRLGEGPAEWARLFCFGLAYAAAAWRCQTLWAAFALHWGWNLSNTLLDTFTRVDTTAPQASALLSAGAHVLLFALIVLLPRNKSAL